MTEQNLTQVWSNLVDYAGYSQPKQQPVSTDINPATTDNWGGTARTGHYGPDYRQEHSPGGPDTVSIHRPVSLGLHLPNGQHPLGLGVPAAALAPRGIDPDSSHPALVTAYQPYAAGPLVEQPIPRPPVDVAASYHTTGQASPAWLHAQGTCKARRRAGRRYFDGGPPAAMELKATPVALPIILRHPSLTDREAFHAHADAKHTPTARSHCSGESITLHRQHNPLRRDLPQAVLRLAGLSDGTGLHTTHTRLSGSSRSVVNSPHPPRQITVALWPFRREVNYSWPHHTNE